MIYQVTMSNPKFTIYQNSFADKVDALNIAQSLANGAMAKAVSDNEWENDREVTISLKVDIEWCQRRLDELEMSLDGDNTDDDTRSNVLDEIAKIESIIENV